MVLQAVFIYYGLPYFSNNTMRFDSIWMAAILIVSINTGAYMAETVRGGIISVDPGQTEGAKAIGMTHVQIMTNVILPQAFRNIIPQIGNNFIINIKDTSVMFIIGFTEFFAFHRYITGVNNLYFPSAAIEMIGYLCMTLIASFLLRWLEKHMDGNDSYELVQDDSLALSAGTYQHPDRGTPFDERNPGGPEEHAPGRSCAARPNGTPRSGRGKRRRPAGPTATKPETRTEGTSDMDEMILQVRHLSKSFGKHEVLRDIDFTVNRGGCDLHHRGFRLGQVHPAAVCQPSGDPHQRGDHLPRGRTFSPGREGAAAYRTKVGMVFQSFNLFNNMSVLDNCTVGQIKVLKKGRPRGQGAGQKNLTKVGMAPYINAKPRQLSGGQKQRVAIAGPWPWTRRSSSLTSPPPPWTRRWWGGALRHAGPGRGGSDHAGGHP